MNIGQANDVFTVLRWLQNRADDAQAAAALARLTDAAHKRLGAGTALTPDQALTVLQELP